MYSNSRIAKYVSLCDVLMHMTVCISVDRRWCGLSWSNDSEVSLRTDSAYVAEAIKPSNLSRLLYN
uniref:Uncharacterized protein n=1 Tax=Ciona intestinalis TaxID=7719 RepID=H2XJW0_CIOIN